MLIILVGPKGSGKTYIGRLLETKLGVRFFHVEPHWMEYHAECAAAGRQISIARGIERIHPLIDECLGSCSAVCVETTGASAEILEDLLRLGRRHGSLLVRVSAPLQLCLQRIAARNPADQIPMRDKEVRQINAMAGAVDLPFDLTLDNAGLTEQQVLRPFEELGVGKMKSGRESSDQARGASSD